MASEYIETDSGTRISRKSHIKGAQYIIIGGKTLIQDSVTLRGDLHNPPKPSSKTTDPIIALGKYSILRSGCTVSPPRRRQAQTTGAEPTEISCLVKIGSYTYIGANTNVQAAAIGTCVYVGDNVTIGPFAIIKDCVVIEDGTQVPPYAVIPPFSRVAGVPAKVTAKLPDSAPEVLELFARKYYTGIDVECPL